MDANRAEAQRCVDIARQHLAQGNADKAKKFLLKAQKLHPEVDVDDLLRKVNGGSGMKGKGDEGGASGDDHPTMNNGYAHFDHYNDPSNLRSRRGKFNSSQSQPSFAQDNPPQSSSSSSTTANGSAPKPKTSRSRTRSADGAPKLGVDFTQEEYDIVQRIRHCKDYYEILNVKKDATEAQLKKEYRKLALQLHPDKCRVPHSTEAFKALGNAYAVLSDTEKRQRYDMYGSEQPQVRRRQSEFYEYDFGRGFEAEFSPEEIFNMFFGGGYPTGAMNRRRGGATFHHHHQQNAHQQQEPGYGPLIQLLPLLAIFVLGIIGQLMVGEPAYSLHRSNKYVEERFTADLRIPYYVKPDFVQNYRGRIQQIEHQVEDEYVSNLRMGCYRERSQKETMAWRARTFGDSQMWEKSQNMPTPNCNRLQELYG